MGEKPRNLEERVAISKGDVARFRQLAPAVLKRHRGGYALEQFSVGVEWVILGLVPIVGMWFWEWKGGELLGFLVAGTWINIFGESLRFVLLWKPMRRATEQFEQEQFVWNMSAALRRGDATIPRQSPDSKHNALAAVIIDFLPGAVGTGLLILLLGDKKPELLREAEAGLRGDVRFGLWGLVGMQGVSVLYEAFHYWFLSDRTREIRSRAGVRGPGLFLLVFLFLIIVVSMERDARMLLTVVNGLFVLLGALSFAGIYFMRGEASWLRDYLAKGERPELVDTID